MVSSVQQSNLPSLKKISSLLKELQTLILASTDSSQGKAFKIKNQENNTGSLWVKMSKGSLKKFEKARNDTYFKHHSPGKLKK